MKGTADNEIIKFETVLTHSFYFQKHDLLFVQLKDASEITVENLTLSNEQSFAVLGKRHVHAAIDVRILQFTHIPREALSYLANNPFGEYQISEAFVISGLGQKLIGNFYLKVIQPRVKSRLFNTLESALEWQGIADKEKILSFIEDSHNLNFSNN